eukprot:CAMPEP_0173425886 /NCGR_PEP_ID=MMETSP1357-20121228/5491_1 /TAXON_ID=77926 /ORGANISM="Hemiselmis rufescens, Strain PCC563" /LENGTH=43 /DNA_ID= /DNA_START= /DNA_END= /DNA_ORIENTATION=
MSSRRILSVSCYVAAVAAIIAILLRYVATNVEKQDNTPNAIIA